MEKRLNQLYEELQGCIEMLQKIQLALRPTTGSPSFSDTNIHLLYLVKGRLSGIESILKDFRD